MTTSLSVGIPRVTIPGVDILSGNTYSGLAPTSTYNGGIGGMRQVTSFQNNFTNAGSNSPGYRPFTTPTTSTNFAMGVDTPKPKVDNNTLWGGLTSEQKMGSILGGVNTLGQLGLGLFSVLEARKQSKDAARRWNMEFEANKRITNGKIKGKEEARRAAMSDGGASRGNIDDYVKQRGV